MIERLRGEHRSITAALMEPPSVLSAEHPGTGAVASEVERHTGEAEKRLPPRRTS